MKFEYWHAFVLGAVLSWGVYVPVLHEGQTSMGGMRETRAIRAFLCVGLAYFITAVLVPLGLMLSGIVDKDFSFTSRGFTFATLGGVAGAAGALCIILSIRFRGDPLYIAPLVFAGAPLVNAVVSMLWHPKGFPDWKFFAGIVLAAIGAGLVLYSKGELDKGQAATAIQSPGVETAPGEVTSHH
jgi:drug/metabolite transporter (DMT)-like permease